MFMCAVSEEARLHSYRFLVVACYWFLRKAHIIVFKFFPFVFLCVSTLQNDKTKQLRRLKWTYSQLTISL